MFPWTSGGPTSCAPVRDYLHSRQSQIQKLILNHPSGTVRHTVTEPYMSVAGTGGTGAADTEGAPMAPRDRVMAIAAIAEAILVVISAFLG